LLIPAGALIILAIAREINAQLTAQNIENLSRKFKVKPKAYELYLQARSYGAKD
jgi:hypothetical protein